MNARAQDSPHPAETHGRHPPPLSFRRPLLIVSLVVALAALVLTAIVYTNPYLAADAGIERALQAIDVGPLVYLFNFYTAIGGPLAIPAEIVIFGLVLILNRHAWRLVIAAALTSGWYLLLNHLVLRPRPTAGQVLRVTEHPGASSFPSGHMILFVVYGVVIMVALGYRFLPPRSRPLAWVVVAVLIAIGGVSRMYSGAHWPSDVLGGMLIAVAWLSFVLSVNWVSDALLGPETRRKVPAEPVTIPAPQREESAT